MFLPAIIFFNLLQSSACDCDPNGSFGGGECETITDVSNTVSAGRCVCKQNVEGRRCDTCKDGFSNLLESNLDGCKCKFYSVIMKVICSKNKNVIANILKDILKLLVVYELKPEKCYLKSPNTYWDIFKIFKKLLELNRMGSLKSTIKYSIYFLTSMV